MSAARRTIRVNEKSRVTLLLKWCRFGRVGRSCGNDVVSDEQEWLYTKTLEVVEFSVCWTLKAGTFRTLVHYTTLRPTLHMLPKWKTFRFVG